MKYTISAFDLHFLIKEFQELINAKVDKIYQPDKNNFLFVLHIPNKGKKILNINLPRYIFTTDFKGETPEQPSQFCLFLRKYLKNSRIREIKQLGFERIIEFLFEKKEGKYKLYIELFSVGNIILCDEESIIKSALITKKWKDRTIRGNIKYEYPRRDVNFLDIKEKDFTSKLKESDKESIVKALALDFGLGGKYSEELCLRTDIKKDRKRIKDDEIKKLYKESRKLIREKVKGYIIKKDNEPMDVVPIKLKLYKDGDEIILDTFSEALNEVLTDIIQTEQKEAVEARESKEANRIKKVISDQEGSIKKLEKTIIENQKKGELIYERYQDIDDILNQLREARKKYSWKEIKEKLKGHKVIKEIHEKNNEIIIEI